MYEMKKSNVTQTFSFLINNLFQSRPKKQNKYGDFWGEYVFPEFLQLTEVQKIIFGGFSKSIKKKLTKYLKNWGKKNKI